MSSRALLAIDTNVGRNHDSTSFHVQHKQSFRLQAPPLKRKERRQGRVFTADVADHGSDKSGHRCPPPSPTFSTPKQWQRFPMACTDNGGSKEGTDGWKSVLQSQGKISPKHILAGDVRLVFPDQSDSESSSDGQLTPRPRNISIEVEKGSEECSDQFCSDRDILSPLVRDDSPSSTSMTDGTFGARRRRSSVASSVKTPSSEGLSTAHTVLNLPVRSPLTPRRMSELHSPKITISSEHDDGTADTAQARGMPDHRSWITSNSQDAEPLSATLKRLGAARKSRSNSTSNRFLEAGDGQQTFGAAHEHWTAQLADEARHRAVAEKELSRGRAAIKEAETLFVREEVVKPAPPSRALPSITERQPEMSLIAPAQTSSLEPRSDSRQARVQSTARGVAKSQALHPNKAAESASRPWSIQRMSTSLASYIFGNHFRARANELEVFYPSVAGGSAAEGAQQPVKRQEKPRGDGWGGLRPRSSWFPSLKSGPLLSPRPANEPTASREGLRSLRLSTQNGVNLKARQSKLDKEDVDDEWEDAPSPRCVREDSSQGQFPNDDSLKRMRVRFPSYLPQPSKDRALPSQKHGEKTDEGTTVVVYTKTSAEGRRVPGTGQRRKPIVIISTILMLCIVLGIALAVKFARLPHQHGAVLPAQESSSLGRRQARLVRDVSTGIDISNMSRRSMRRAIPSHAKRRSMVLEAVKESR